MRIETHPLRGARRALLLLGETGEKGEIGGVASAKPLVAELTLTEDASYRFWLQPPFGRAVREERSHHLTAEADAPPRVEILGPADRLELATPRPIEIGYSASDDFGVGIVELVTAPAIAPSSGSRCATAAARARCRGERCGIRRRGARRRRAHRLSDRGARSRRRVGRPRAVGKSGSSRTLYVIIQNPHESLEDRLERQRDLLEKLIGDLAERLEHEAGRRRRRWRCADYASVHEAEEAHLALLGQLIDEDRRNGTMGKTLRAALGGVADRLEKLLREEAQALAAFKGKPPRGRPGAPATRCRRATSPSWRTTCCCSTI